MAKSSPAVASFAAASISLMEEVEALFNEDNTPQEGPQGPEIDASPASALAVDHPQELPLVTKLPPVTAPKKKGEAPVKKQKGPTYPFRGEKALREELTLSSEARVRCLMLLFAAQTSDEQEHNHTVWRNHMGFMSSHAVRGSLIAKALLTLPPEERLESALSPEDQSWMAEKLPSYAKQMARRELEDRCEADPSLKEIARIFSVKI